jgi:methyl-accepting chemotaxis protein
MKLKDISIKAKLTLLAVLFVAAMLVFVVLAYTTINGVKIGSHAYDMISVATRIVGDFSPPTQFVSLERLIIFRARVTYADKAKLDQEIDSFKTLMKDFEDGHTQWRNSVTDPKMAELLEKIYEPGRTYLDIAWNKYFPLLQQGDVAGADKVRIEELLPLYEQHKAAMQEFARVAFEHRSEAESSIQAMVASRTFTLATVSLVTLALLVGFCFIIAKGILTPLHATVAVLHEVSLGNLTRRLEVTGKDEIAQMGIALNDTVDNLSRIMSEIGSDARVLTDTSKELTTNSQELGNNSQQTTTQAAAVSSAAAEVSQNVQTVSTATDEMSASIKEISKNASEAAEVASSAARLAGSTTATMTKLSESSAEIGNVVKVITSIAEQTNLLALNATIEAARAGEAGKGFAVVANEVKELAKETAKATEDISNKVEAIQNDAKGAVQAIEEITTVIGRINDIQNTIASAVEEQTGTTNEISRNISETSRGSSDIASNITGVASAAKETQKSASASLLAAGELSKLAVRLGNVVSQFKLSSNGNHANKHA